VWNGKEEKINGTSTGMRCRLDRASDSFEKKRNSTGGEVVVFGNTWHYNFRAIQTRGVEGEEKAIGGGERDASAKTNPKGDESGYDTSVPVGLTHGGGTKLIS